MLAERLEVLMDAVLMGFKRQGLKDGLVVRRDGGARRRVAKCAVSGAHDACDRSVCAV